MRTATGKGMQLLLARSELNQPVGKPFFYHFKLNATDKRSIATARKKKHSISGRRPRLKKHLCLSSLLPLRNFELQSNYQQVAVEM